MKQQRWYYHLLLFCFLFLSSVTFVRAIDCDDDFDFDDPIFDIPPIEPKTKIILGLKSVVKKPLWEQTNIPNGRDVLYLMPYKITNLQAGGIFINFFFNSTNRMKVTLDEVFNAESINLALKGIVELLSSSSNSAELTRIAPLLKKMTLQERKAGALIQAGVTRGPFAVQLHTSVLFSERNFWLSKQDRQEIRALILRTFPEATSIEEGQFYKIKVGLGDTRLKVGLNLLNLRKIQADVGFEGIIPTSDITSNHRIKRGIVTDPNKLLPILLDRTQRLILEPRLGNRGHFGFGIYFESKMNFWNDAINIWNRLSFDHFFKNDEDRLLLFKKTLLPEDLTCDNLTQFLREYVVPSVFRVSVLPGSIVSAIIGLDYKIGDCRLGFGYDYYLQRRERFLNIVDGNRDELLLGNATAPLAEQHKFFIESLYVKKYKRSQLHIGFGADATIASTNIGKDWTIYFKLGLSF